MGDWHICLLSQRFNSHFISDRGYLFNFGIPARGYGGITEKII
jgi:hypothetical protein